MYQISIYTNQWHDIQAQGSETSLINPVLREKLNGCGSLTYSVAKNDQYYNDYIRFKTKVMVRENGAILFIGRLLEIKKDLLNTMLLTFEGDMAMLNDIQYPPYEFSGTIAELFVNVLTYYNSKCSNSNKILRGNITVTDSNNYIARKNEDYSTCWSVLYDKLVKLCGGYLQVRWVFSQGTVTRYLDYLSNPGSSPTQKIEFGKNIIDINQELTGTDLITVLIPFGAKDESTGQRITIESVNPTGQKYIISSKYTDFGYIEAVQYWDDVTLPVNLYNKAVEYLREHDSTGFSIKVSAIDLHVIDGTVERLDVGDSVTVKSTPHSLNTSMLITERERNLNDVSKDVFTIGNEEKTFTSESDAESMNINLDANALDGVDVQYGVSTSSQVAPTEWSTTSPTWEEGKYIWQRTKSSYIDGTTAYSNPVCIQGAKGQDGQDGEDGEDGQDGTSYYTFIKYGDSMTPSTMYDNPSGHSYIGVYTGTSSTAPTSYTSYKWNKYVGSDGQDGEDGQDGKDGNGINSISYWYMTTQTYAAPSKDSPDWSQTMPTMSTTNKYLWQKEIIDFTDSTVSDKITVGLIAVHGANGRDGEDGEDGQDGTSVTIKSTSIMYQASSSGTVTPTGTWSTNVPSIDNGKYLWTRTIVVYNDDTNTTSYAVAYKGTNGTNGTDGTDGDDGRGISSIKEQYALGTSETVAPTTGWQDTCPTWQSGKYIWTRSEVVWMNPTETTHTTPICANGLNKANQNAQDAIDSVPSDEHIETIAEQQTKLLLGSEGGTLHVTYNEQNKPNGFIITDSDDLATAQNVWIWNKDGIGFSNTGYHGQYHNAWTIDGNLDATFITTGVLKDKTGNFSLDLDTGILEADRFTIKSPDFIFGEYPDGRYVEAKTFEEQQTGDSDYLQPNGSRAYFKDIFTPTSNVKYKYELTFATASDVDTTQYLFGCVGNSSAYSMLFRIEDKTLKYGYSTTTSSSYVIGSLSYTLQPNTKYKVVLDHTDGSVVLYDENDVELVRKTITSTRKFDYSNMGKMGLFTAYSVAGDSYNSSYFKGKIYGLMIYKDSVWIRRIYGNLRKESGVYRVRLYIDYREGSGSPIYNYGIDPVGNFIAGNPYEKKGLLFSGNGVTKFNSEDGFVVENDKNNSMACMFSVYHDSNYNTIEAYTYNDSGIYQTELSAYNTSSTAYVILSTNFIGSSDNDEYNAEIQIRSDSNGGRISIYNYGANGDDFNYMVFNNDSRSGMVELHSYGDIKLYGNHLYFNNNLIK